MIGCQSGHLHQDNFNHSSLPQINDRDTSSLIGIVQATTASTLTNYLIILQKPPQKGKCPDNEFLDIKSL